MQANWGTILGAAQPSGAAAPPGGGAPEGTPSQGVPSGPAGQQQVAVTLQVRFETN